MRLSLCPKARTIVPMIDGDKDKEKGMTVCVRVRPLSQKEIDQGQRNCCQVIGNSIVAIRKEGSGGYLKSEQPTINDYAFDAAFDESSTQAEVYQNSAKKYIPNLLLGLNVTVFCYGATGAGKTHTMLGNTRSDDAAAHAEAGIIPNAVSDLFQLIEERKRQNAAGSFGATEDWTVIGSFIEVYNEQVYDLLESSGKVLSLREDSERGVVMVAGVTEQRVDGYDSVLELLHHGNRNRKTEATMANAVSSRSHAVLQLTIRHTKRMDGGRESVSESKLSMIDLAGSERASATNNRGVRLQEGANINKSLLALANCINALSSNSTSSKQGNVKYRDSKLTHLLKSSLEGNCNLVMIANINPSHGTYEDSHNTLKYANRAKNMKVNPQLKESVKDSTWVEREARLREENEQLKLRVLELEKIIFDLQQSGVTIPGYSNFHENLSPVPSSYEPQQIEASPQRRRVKASRRDTLVPIAGKDNVSMRRAQSPLRGKVIVETPSLNQSIRDENTPRVNLSSSVHLDDIELSLPGESKKKKHLLSNDVRRIGLRNKRDENDDGNDDDQRSRSPAGGHHHSTGPSHATSSSSSNGGHASSSSRSVTHNAQGQRRSAFVGEGNDCMHSDCPVSIDRSSQSASRLASINDASTQPAPCEFTMSLANMDGMFDVLSDSILEAGLFSTADDVPTPIRGNFVTMKATETSQQHEATPSEYDAISAPVCLPEVGSATRLTQGAEFDAPVSSRVNTKKRRASFIPTARASRKSIFLADEIFDESAQNAVEPIASVASGSGGNLPDVGSINIPKQIKTLTTKPTRKPLYLHDDSEVIIQNGQENFNPQLLRQEPDLEVVRKPVAAGNLDRRKSLATISTMLNSLSTNTATVMTATSQVQTRSRTSLLPSNGQIIASENAPVGAVRTSTRRKSILG